MTVFVQRVDGKITGVYENLQPGYAEEEIPADHPEVLEFMGRFDR